MRARHAALICAALLFAGADAAAAAPLAFSPCRGTPDYECAELSVPLDPTGAQPGALSLHVRRLVETRDAEGVLVALAGGPGQSSTRFIDDFGDVLAEGLENRQLVVLDQRGTGDSGALRCDGLDGAPAALRLSRLVRRVGQCGEELGATRRYFTTTEVVEDLEALRLGLAVPRISLFGISYGTYVAQRYARRYPASVDRLVLDSPVAQDQGGSFDQSSYDAVAGMLRGLCSEGRCREITRDPVADLRRVVRRLRAGPLRALVFDSNGHGTAQTLASEAELFDLLVSTDFSPALRAGLPAAVRSAAGGDAALLLRLLAIDSGSSDRRELDEQKEDPVEFSNALFFATTCQEKPLPWESPETPVAERRSSRALALAALPGAFSPFGREAADSTQLGTAFCERWPPTAVAPVPPPGPIDAQALVLSGRADLRTPTAEAARTAALISDASTIAVAGAPHSLVSSRLRCVQTALTRFFADESVGNPCAAVTAGALAPLPAPLAPKRVRQVPRERLRGRGARAAAAALATVRDAVRVASAQGLIDAPFAFGGLHGGSACARPGAANPSGRRPLVLVLDGVAYLPGLRLSGRVVSAGRAIVRMRLSLQGRPQGSLRLARRAISGRLGGRRVRLRVRAGTLVVSPAPVAEALAPRGPAACG